MQKWEGEGKGRRGGSGRSGARGAGRGRRAEKAGKIKGAGRGVGNELKKRVRPNFRTGGRRIRWRVPELTPNTPSRPRRIMQYILILYERERLAFGVPDTIQRPSRPVMISCP